MSPKKFNADGFSEKLSLVNRTKESVHNVAQWILEHKNHCFEITDVWLKSVENADVSHRLTLFYVANDVVQQCKKQDASRYREAFANTLELAMPFANDSSIKFKIERLVQIWEQRGIYHPDFLKGLQEKLNETQPEVVEESRSDSPIDLNEAGNFKVNLNCALQELKKLTAAVRKQRLLGGIENFSIDVESIPSIGQTQGVEVLRRLNQRITNTSAYISAVEKETDQRRTVIRELEKTEKFYVQQLTDVQTVAKAYKAFGRKLKKVQKCLAEKKSLLQSSSSEAAVLSSPSGGLPVKKEISSPVEVSTLEKRLSLLAQNSCIKEVGSEYTKLDCSSPGQPAVKSPQNTIGGLEHSPSRVYSACEGVESSHMDVDPCTPGSVKVSGSPNSIGSSSVVVNNSPVSVQVVDLTENKFPGKENQSVQMSKINSPARQELHSEPHLHSIEPPKVGPLCSEDISNQSTVHKAGSPVEGTPVTQNSSPCQGIKNSFQQNTTAQAHLPMLADSKCSPITNSTESDVEVLLVCQNSSNSNEAAHKGNSCSDLHKEGHVGGEGLAGSMHVCKENSIMSSGLPKNSSSALCIQPAGENQVRETTHSSSSSGLQPKNECNGGEEEIVILSENLKIAPKRHVENNQCSPQMMYNLLQSIVAYRRITAGNCNSRVNSDHGSEQSRDVIGLYSLLLKASSNRRANLKMKKSGECEVITIVDDHKETEENCGNCNKVQVHLPASAGKGREGNAPANLEVMDMDLGSSDDEMA